MSTKILQLPLLTTTVEIIEKIYFTRSISSNQSCPSIVVSQIYKQVASDRALRLFLYPSSCFLPYVVLFVNVLSAAGREVLDAIFLVVEMTVTSNIYTTVTSPRTYEVNANRMISLHLKPLETDSFISAITSVSSSLVAP